MASNRVSSDASCASYGGRDDVFSSNSPQVGGEAGGENDETMHNNQSNSKLMKNALFGLMFVMAKDDSLVKTDYATFVLLAIDFLQLMAFPFSRRAGFPWAVNFGAVTDLFDLYEYLGATSSWYVLAMYIATFAAVTFILCLSIYVSIVMTRERNFHSIYDLKTLLNPYTVAPALVSSLFIPLLKVFVSLMSCPYAESCTSSVGPMIIQVLVVLEGVFFFSFAFLVAASFFDDRAIDGGLRARAHTRADTVYLLFRGTLVLAFGVYADSTIVLLFIMVVGSGIVLYTFTYYVPYYNAGFSRVRMYLIATFFWTACMCALSVAYNNTNDMAPVWTLCTCYPLVLMLVDMVTAYRHRLLLQYPVDECVSSYEVELKIRLFMQTALTSYRRRCGRYVHADAALDSEFQEAVEQGFLAYQFAASLPRFRRSAQLHLFFYHFVVTFCDDAEFAAELLSTAEHCGPRIDEEYLIYQAKTKVLEKELARAHALNIHDGEDMTGDLTETYYLRTMNASLLSALTAEEKFWAELMCDVPNSNTLQGHAVTYHRHLEKLKVDVRGLMVLLDKNFASYDARELCARVLVDRGIDAERGRDMLDDLADRRAHEQHSKRRLYRKKSRQLSMATALLSPHAAAASSPTGSSVRGGGSGALWLSRSGTPRNSPRAASQRRSPSAFGSPRSLPASPGTEARRLARPPAAVTPTSPPAGGARPSFDDGIMLVSPQVLRKHRRRRAQKKAQTVDNRDEEGGDDDNDALLMREAIQAMVRADAEVDGDGDVTVLTSSSPSPSSSSSSASSSPSSSSRRQSSNDRRHHHSTLVARCGDDEVALAEPELSVTDMRASINPAAADSAPAPSSSYVPSMAMKAMEERLRRQLCKLVERVEDGLGVRVLTLKRTTMCGLALLLVLAVLLFVAQVTLAAQFRHESDTMINAHGVARDVLMTAVHVRSADLHFRHLSPSSSPASLSFDIISTTNALSATVSSFTPSTIVSILPPSSSSSSIASYTQQLSVHQAVKAFVFHATQVATAAASSSPPLPQRSVSFVVRNADSRYVDGLVSSLDRLSHGRMAQLDAIAAREEHVAIGLSLVMLLVCVAWLIMVPRSVHAMIGDLHRVSDVYYELPRHIVTRLHQRADEKLTSMRRHGRIVLDEEMTALASPASSSSSLPSSSSSSMTSMASETTAAQMTHNRLHNSKLKRKYIARLYITFMCPLFLLTLSLAWNVLFVTTDTELHRFSTLYSHARVEELHTSMQLQCMSVDALHEVRELVVENTHGCNSSISRVLSANYPLLNLPTSHVRAVVDNVGTVNHALMFGTDNGVGGALGRWPSLNALYSVDACTAAVAISPVTCDRQWPGGVGNAMRVYTNAMSHIVSWQASHGGACTNSSIDDYIIATLNSSAMAVSNEALHHVLYPNLKVMTGIFDGRLRVPRHTMLTHRMYILIALICVVCLVYAFWFIPTLNLIVSDAKRSRAVLSIMPIHTLATLKSGGTDSSSSN